MSDAAPTTASDPVFDLDVPEEQWLQRMREALKPEALTELGPYELLEEICRGGQGIVYRARRRGDNGPAAGCVAVKRLLGGDFASPSARRRFEREVEAVSSLNHPGIISVIGVENDGGQPLLAMEWVDGRPVTRWANPASASGEPRRSVAEITDMMLAICDAVQHAHQHGVIHRDLKPSNILVDALNRPHVLDFGLVKFVETDAAGGANRSDGGRAPVADPAPLTLSEQFVGTRAYAAPEQVPSAGGNGAAPAVDTRSDVYALGLIMYEMLTGRLPFQTPADAARSLHTVDCSLPPRASSLRPEVNRELEAVLHTALAREPAERYQSIDALAADLRRYSRGDPVLARGPGRWFLLRTTLRRYRVAVAFLAMFFALVSIGGAVAGVLASNLAHSRRQEHAARETAERINGFLHEVLAAADPMGERGPETTAREVLDAAALRIETQGHVDPYVEAAVRNTLGLAYHNLGLWTESQQHLERALALRQQLYPDGHADLANSLSNLAVLRYSQRRFDDAERLSRDALALHERVLGPRSDETAEDLNNLGAILRAQGRLDEARQVLEKALAIRREISPTDTRRRTEILTNLAGVLRAQQRPAEAEPLLRDVLRLRREALGGSHPDVAQSLDNLAVVMAIQGRYREAADLMREALSIYRARLGADHPDTATSLANLGTVQYRAGELEAAVASLGECLRIREALLPADDARLLATLTLLSTALMDLNRPGEAEPLMRRVYDAHVRANSWSEETTGMLVDRLIRAYEELGRPDEAEWFRSIRRRHPQPGQ